MDKSSTDLHWNERAQSEESDETVNIGDVAQREVEIHHILPHLKRDQRVLEVGCGNGYLTNLLRTRVAHVDAFDYSENMIERAKKAYGEKNNRFFQDNILAPEHFNGPYDLTLCVRVLINLRDTEEQKTALGHLASSVRPGGTLVLAEGYLDGFGTLSELRKSMGMPPLQPAAINHYSAVAELMPTIEKSFEVRSTFHSGMFDVLTRVVYPALVGPENAKTSDFHQKILEVTKQVNPEGLAPYGRIQGMVLEKRA